MRLRGILFAIALVFGVWNIFNQGLNVQSGAILLMILVCLAMNIYNYHQKQKEREATENALREKEEIRRMRAEARHRQSRKGRKKK
ncbi:Uncharacterised protein [Bacteroides xylanisolvens]|nr:Uncharacterised protein [Bacteroides xylanisolvens]